VLVRLLRDPDVALPEAPPMSLPLLEPGVCDIPELPPYVLWPELWLELCRDEPLEDPDDPLLPV